ncbi:hypothetical protein G6F23_014349 [Rhizopus arrhizus]|nr:hypothetical protein G6F23_014349 [Rhizopus arrhizus]
MPWSMPAGRACPPTRPAPMPRRSSTTSSATIRPCTTRGDSWPTRSRSTASGSKPGRPCCWYWLPPQRGAPGHACPGQGLARRHAADALVHLLQAGVDPAALASHFRYRPLPNARVPQFAFSKEPTP